jgi:hypothetical protein
MKGGLYVMVGNTGKEQIDGIKLPAKNVCQKKGV